MSRSRALAELDRLRRRERDDARRRLADARHAQACIDERRRGWRRRLEAEAAAGDDDPAALAHWLEGCRARERALAAEAARAAEAVATAAEADRLAQLRVEQVETLRARARAAARRAAMQREQRWLDELKPMPGE